MKIYGLLVLILFSLGEFCIFLMQVPVSSEVVSVQTIEEENTIEDTP